MLLLDLVDVVVFLYCFELVWDVLVVIVVVCGDVYVVFDIDVLLV